MAIDAKDVTKIVIASLVAIIVFGALIFTMADTYQDVALGCTNDTSGEPQDCGTDPTNETRLFSTAAEELALLGPLFLVIGIIALPIGLALYFFTRYV